MVAKKVVKYEEWRLKRLEENMKRMEELKLHKLSLDLRTPTPNLSQMRKVKPRVPRSPLDLSSVRRSNRVADKPPPIYKEEPIEPLGKRRSYGSSSKRDLSNRVYASDEDREFATDKAQELESNLKSQYPSFVKPMLQSHVTGGFWLGLPHNFIKSHLSKHDETMVLVDEDGNEWPTNYLARKSGLSGGWKAFACDHGLVDGDALVFQLIKPTRFKVYIIRVNQYQAEDSDEAPDVANLDINSKRIRASKK